MDYTDFLAHDVRIILIKAEYSQAWRDSVFPRQYNDFRI